VPVQMSTVTVMDQPSLVVNPSHGETRDGDPVTVTAPAVTVTVAATRSSESSLRLTVHRVSATPSLIQAGTASGNLTES
jgi:hypothetical protein